MKKRNDRRPDQHLFKLACLMVELARLVIEALIMDINYRLGMRY